MKLSQKGLAQALGLGWGGAILLIGVANLIFHPYGQSFLQAGSRKRPDTRQAVGHGSSGPPQLIPGRLAEAQERGTMIHVQG